MSESSAAPQMAVAGPDSSRTILVGAGFAALVGAFAARDATREVANYVGSETKPRDFGIRLAIFVAVLIVSIMIIVRLLSSAGNTIALQPEPVERLTTQAEEEKQPPARPAAPDSLQERTLDNARVFGPQDDTNKLYLDSLYGAGAYYM
jgi:hypothetical protein